MNTNSTKYYCYFRDKGICKIGLGAVIGPQTRPHGILQYELDCPVISTRPRGLMLTCERIHLLFDLS